MRRTVLLVVVLAASMSAVNASAARWPRDSSVPTPMPGSGSGTGTPAAHAKHARTPAFPHLPGAWSHAEINIKVAGTPHTLILDRGRIVDAAPDHMTLVEGDGSIVTVPLSDQTIVSIDGASALRAGLARKMKAETMRIDGGAAVRVAAQSLRR
jgi:hypothetical protein